MEPFKKFGETLVISLDFFDLDAFDHFLDIGNLVEAAGYCRLCTENLVVFHQLGHFILKHRLCNFPKESIAIGLADGLARNTK